MTEAEIRRLLEQVAVGRVSAAQALQRLRYLPFENLGFARLDNHRTLRRDIPEVVFGGGKSVQQIVKIGQRMTAAGINLMVTRLDSAKAGAVKRSLRRFDYRPEARVGLLLHQKPEPRGHGTVMVASAGTSDIPVAEEAAVSAEFFGNRVERLYDVGVAGLHRLTSQLKMLERDYRRRRDGGGSAVGSRWPSKQTGDRGADQCWLRRSVRRCRATNRNAQQLCRRPNRGEHRQWFWRGVSRNSN